MSGDVMNYYCNIHTFFPSIARADYETKRDIASDVDVKKEKSMYVYLGFG